jgi:hypothetical protein
VPADTKAPVIMIQTPLDLFLPAGVTLSVDGGNPVPFELQTCNVKGCYAGAKLPNAGSRSYARAPWLSGGFAVAENVRALRPGSAGRESTSS